MAMTEPMPVTLADVLARRSALAVAVSGGVDSLTLAWAAGRVPGLSLTVLHAAGPAVPVSATQRVREHARRASWTYREINAGEYDDPNYRRNPADRCYFCKNNLYDRIRGASSAPIAAGTNLDDLGDFRPGLTAAKEHHVVHPFVEAGMNKAAVRRLASEMGLTDIAELPAQPCLASRVETGIAIDAADLAFIDMAERQLMSVCHLTDIRCRITRQGVWFETAQTGDMVSQASDNPAMAVSVTRFMQQLCADAGRIYAGWRPYRRGSAFLVSPQLLAKTIRRQQL